MTQSQSKNKTLVFIILLLLLTNILVLGYFLYYKKQPHTNKGRDTFATILQKEVGFTQQQVDDFNNLKKNHWEQAKTDMKHIMQIKNNIFDLTRVPNTPDSVIEKLADSIGLLQKNVEIETYKHISATRKLCTPEQQPAYDTLMKKLINRGRGKTSGNSSSHSTQEPTPNHSK